LFFDHLIPDQYTESLENIKSTDCTLAEHEEETFGITHAELGKRFIERWWPVSPDMVKAIGTHHDDTGADGNVKHIAHLLTTANLLANQNGFGNEQSYLEMQHPWNTACWLSLTWILMNWKF
jgi:hypothetical protein